MSGFEFLHEWSSIKTCKSSDYAELLKQIDVAKLPDCMLPHINKNFQYKYKTHTHVCVYIHIHARTHARTRVYSFYAFNELFIFTFESKK